MKQTILYILFFIILGLKSCCYSDDPGTRELDRFIGVRMINPSDSIFSISYPNSITKIQSFSNKSKLYLSDAFDSTIIFFQSSKGFDTVIVESKKHYFYYGGGRCYSSDFIKISEITKIKFHTFDTCYFIHTFREFNYFSDTLYIK